MLSRPILITFLVIAALAALAVLVRNHRRQAEAGTGSGGTAAAGPQRREQPPSRVTVYDGSIPVAGNAYRHTALVGEDYADTDIPGLDTVVSRAPSLSFTLDYPFDEPFEGRIVGVEGITLRHIIDAIRDGYRQMYEATSTEDIPNIANKKVTGSYGTAMHVIDDLVIESIELDGTNNTLTIFIGS